MKIKIACASDDIKNFTKNHFGDARYFLIYEFDLDNLKIKFLEKISNNSGEEERHGDPLKAKSIAQIIQGIDLVFGFAFGPNIVSMRKKFLPVISREINIEKSLIKLRTISKQILEELKKKTNQEREIIILN